MLFVRNRDIRAEEVVVGQVVCLLRKMFDLEEVFIAQNIIYSRLASASMARKCSRRVYAV